MFTAALTAFYTFRAYFLTFWGELKVPPEADMAHHGHSQGHAVAEAGPHHHGPAAVGQAAHPQADAAHAPATPRHGYESPPVMTIPLLILAVFALFVGFVVGPLMPPSWRLSHFLELTPGLPEVVGEHNVEWGLMALSGIIALGGIGVAWVMYLRRPDLPGKLAAAWQVPTSCR